MVSEVGKEAESITRLARIGFDTVEGYLAGGINTWINAQEQIDIIIDIEADELAMDIPHDSKLEILDVRKETEYAEAHVQSATNLPLNGFGDIMNLAMIEPDRNLYIHCAGGYRSVIAASLLKKQGFHNLRNVLGGFASIKENKSISIVQELSKLN